MSSLCHLVYTSAATRNLSENDLALILEAARASNRHRCVTGILLHIEGTFFQVIEGEPEVVQALFERIRQDPRHSHVTTIIQEPIAKRAFGEWTMGYDFVSEQDLEIILDVHGVRGNEHSVCRLKEGRARRLLSAFSEGSWRNRVAQR
ncbi:MAG: BLUF domain-containing protein [Janthinobacterium lividum]